MTWIWCTSLPAVKKGRATCMSAASAGTVVRATVGCALRPVMRTLPSRKSENTMKGRRRLRMFDQDEFGRIWFEFVPGVVSPRLLTEALMSRTASGTGS